MLRPRLAVAQQALAAALDEACEIDVEGADVPTLLRLEEQLTVAQESASKAIAALRRVVPEEAVGIRDAQVPHRLYVDDHGVEWDAFVVQPSRSRGKDTLPAPYDSGWLAIQCPEGVRRVAPIPADWRECSRDEFCKYVEASPVAPRRKT